MKQPYNFEKGEPPVLSEKKLRREIERRRVKRQVTLLALAGLSAQLGMLWASLLLYPAVPVLAKALFIYIVASFAGGGVLAIFVVLKRRKLLWQAL